MASNPPGECCTRGFKHEGTPAGEMFKIGQYDAYIARPSTPKPKRAILFVSDVMGVYENSKLLADDFASRGYLTLVPDLFHGEPLTLNAFASGTVDLPGFLAKHNIASVEPVLDAALKYLRETEKVEKIAGVGYCFGAKYVVRYMKGRRVDVGYIAHPSFVSEDELRAIEGPLTIAAAETDTIFPADLRHKSEEILKETKQPYQVTLYSHVEHGFAVRADLSVPAIKFAKEQAFLQAIAWFEYFL
ncbi:hypothetical protein VTO42DRAFT_7570 [Malbranchea cinnamomea]